MCPPKLQFRHSISEALFQTHILLLATSWNQSIGHWNNPFFSLVHGTQEPANKHSLNFVWSQCQKYACVFMSEL